MMIRRTVPKTENNTRLKRRMLAAIHRRERKRRNYLQEFLQRSEQTGVSFHGPDH